MLNTRLQTILDILPEVQSVVDVGTDHCLLPIAIKQKYPSMEVAAADVAKGPLASAQKQLQDHNIEDIQLYLSNGVHSIDKQYECVIVAGMGANTMMEIMEQDLQYCKNCKYLILQANKDVDLLRKWLNEHDFSIVNERMVFDYKYYQILVVTNGKQTLSEEDIVFGPILRKQHDEVYVQYWKQELEKFKGIVQQLPENHPKLQLANEMIHFIENNIN